MNKGQERKAKSLKLHGKQQKQMHGKNNACIHKKLTPAAPRPVGISKKKKKKSDGQGEASMPKTEGKPSSLSTSMYAQSHRILLLGEGDFSFAAALALLWSDASSITATAFDDEAATLSKYATAGDNIETLRSLGAKVLFGVDATRLNTVAQLRQEKKGFDRVVFNFP